jgi:hypothetical protein
MSGDNVTVEASGNDGWTYSDSVNSSLVELLSSGISFSIVQNNPADGITLNTSLSQFTADISLNFTITGESGLYNATINVNSTDYTYADVANDTLFEFNFTAEHGVLYNWSVNASADISMNVSENRTFQTQYAPYIAIASILPVYTDLYTDLNVSVNYTDVVGGNLTATWTLVHYNGSSTETFVQDYNLTTNSTYDLILNLSADYGRRWLQYDNISVAVNVTNSNGAKSPVMNASKQIGSIVRTMDVDPICNSPYTHVTMTSDLSCTGSGPYAGAVDSFLDCAGHKITYNTLGAANDVGVAIPYARSNLSNCIIKDGNALGGKWGVDVTGAQNVIIKNTAVNTSSDGIQAYTLAFEASSNYGTAHNLTLDANGAAGGGAAVHVHDTAYVNVTNSSLHSWQAGGIWCEDSSYVRAVNNVMNGTDGVEPVGSVSTSCDNAQIYNNTIYVNGTFAATGINTFNSQYMDIQNNTIYVLASGTNNDGIYMSYIGNSINISGNKIIVNSTGNTNTGIRSESAQTLAKVNNNDIVVDAGATTDNAGIRFASSVYGVSTYQSFNNNNITMVGSAGTVYGVLFSSAAGVHNYNNVTNTRILLVEGYGVYIGATADAGNLFRNVNITSASATRQAIYDAGNGANNFENIRLNSTAYFSVSTAQAFKNLTIIGTKGDVTFQSQSISGATTQAEINITQNKAFVNTTALSVLNTTATIDLFGITFTHPHIKYSSSGVFSSNTTCMNCMNTSYSGGIFTFEVPSWSGYSVEEMADIAAPTPIGSCSFAQWGANMQVAQANCSFNDTAINAAYFEVVRPGSVYVNATPTEINSTWAGGYEIFANYTTTYSWLEGGGYTGHYIIVDVLGNEYRSPVVFNWSVVAISGGGGGGWSYSGNTTVGTNTSNRTLITTITPTPTPTPTPAPAKEDYAYYFDNPKSGAIYSIPGLFIKDDHGQATGFRWLVLIIYVFALLMVFKLFKGGSNTREVHVYHDKEV